MGALCFPPDSCAVSVPCACVQCAPLAQRAGGQMAPRCPPATKPTSSSSSEVGGGCLGDVHTQQPGPVAARGPSAPAPSPHHPRRAALLLPAAGEDIQDLTVMSQPPAGQTKSSVPDDPAIISAVSTQRSRLRPNSRAVAAEGASPQSSRPGRGGVARSASPGWCLACWLAGTQPALKNSCQIWARCQITPAPNTPPPGGAVRPKYR